MCAYVHVCAYACMYARDCVREIGKSLNTKNLKIAYNNKIFIQEIIIIIIITSSLLHGFP